MLKEDLEVVTAKAVYLDDIEVRNVAYLGVVRSNVARGIVKSMTPPSRAELFLTSKDVKAYIPTRDVPDPVNIVKMPVLAEDVVNFVGQPVAAFVVNDPYEIEDVMDEVYVDIEPLKPVVTIDEALRGEEKVHEKGNVAVDARIKGGDLGQKANSEVEVEREFEFKRIVANPLEPKGIVVHWDGERLNVIASTQSAFRIKGELQEVLGLPPEKVVVVSAPRVGGGFGNKISVYPEYVLAAIASMKLRRPVKWVETRREHLNNPVQGRSMKAKLKLHAKRDGTVLGISGEVIFDGGAYMMSIGPYFPYFVLNNMIFGPYKMRFIDVRGLVVYTNKPPYGAYRGAGRPEAASLHEMLMETLAEELKTDPAELRKKNLLESGREYVLPSGVKVDPAGYREVFERAEQLYRKLTSEGKKAVIIALNNLVNAPPGEYAKVSVGKGKVRVYVGSGPHGQPHWSMYSKVVSQALGISEDLVEVQLNRTDVLKEGVGSFGSRTANVGTHAVLTAVNGLLDELKRRGLTLQEALKSETEIEYETFAKADASYTPGAAVAYADIDPETCQPRVRELHVFFDVGRAIIKEEVEGQIIGGATQGLAQVMYEAMEYDEYGNPLYISINDEGVPYADDVTWKVYVYPMEVYPAKTLGGARGIGELGTSAGLAAGILAVEKALGRKLREVPARPWEIC